MDRKVSITDSGIRERVATQGAPILVVRLLPIVLVKKRIKCLKQRLFFAKQSAKIMLIFLKVLVGYIKMLTFFRFF